MVSSGCFSVVSLLLIFLISATASSKFIDVICQSVVDKSFCLQTLNAYPPAASATDKLQAAEATLRLVISHAKKSAVVAGKAAKENPNLKEQFEGSQDAFVYIIKSLNSALGELKESPETSNYDVKVCSDSTEIVRNLVGKNTDHASKTVMVLTEMMDKLRDIALRATEAAHG